jgi:Domain of unknown function (DUF2828)
MENRRSLLVDAARQHDSVTANGAVTHSTSLNYCVDLFFLAGASRRMPEGDILSAFYKAMGENREIALKILFWARDCRGGAGEKRFFQVIAKELNEHYPKMWDQLAIHIPEYGYWKDVFKIEQPNENNLNWLMNALDESPNANLLAKFFPRRGPWFKAMHMYLKMTPKEFRQKLVSMTKVVETAMCNGEWDKIKYPQVPSYAMNMYRNAFKKHDEVRYAAYIDDVLGGKEKINASVLFPHQLYQAMNQGGDHRAIEAQWQALPDYMAGSTERILPVCDTSSSMSGLPMDVSVALGLYISERNQGIFKDAFITFNDTPEMLYVQGESLHVRMKNLARAPWGGSTNLQASFDLILDAAVRNSLPESEMPTKLLIISDMEFNQIEGYRHKTNLEVAREKYKAAGYTMPDIVFWNVNGRLGNVPAKASDPGVGLVSGFSPAILTSILAGKGFTPVDLMMQAIGGERYARILIHED